MQRVIRLDDARFLKSRGALLNTPIEDRTFSAEYTDRWLKLMIARAKFMTAVAQHSEKPSISSSLGRFAVQSDKIKH